MAHIRIDMQRGTEWTVRQEGDLDISVADLVAALPGYTLQYPHRLYVDGTLIATSTVKRGKVTVTRHDAA